MMFLLFLSFSLFICTCIANEEIGLISEVPTTLTRHLLNTGFHRQLTTSIQLQHHHQSTLHLQDHSNCTLMVVETFTPGIYVDPYEVAELERLGSGIHVHFFTDIDLEKPAYLSTKNVVLVYHSFEPLTQSQTINITIPIHFRYQLPSSSSSSLSSSPSPSSSSTSSHYHRLVYINSPLIYISCNGKKLPPSSSDNIDSSVWIRLIPTEPDPNDINSNDNEKSNTDTNKKSNSVLIGNNGIRLVVEIPVGQRDMEGVVAAVTVAVTVAGALLITYFVVTKTSKRKEKHE